MTAPPRLTAAEIARWLGPYDRLLILLCGVLAFALSALRQDWGAALFCGWLGAATASIVIIDLRHFRIPDLLSLPLIPLGLLHTALSQPLWPRLVAMALVWIGLQLLGRGFRHWRGRTGLGGGDLKLITAAAAWLPPEVLPTYLLCACLTGLIAAITSRPNHRGVIAFGVHLAPWLVAVVLFG